MEFDLKDFVDDFINTILYDIENTKDQHASYLYGDLKETIYSKLHEYDDMVLAQEKDRLRDDAFDTVYNQGYDDGYERGWNNAREEIQELVNEMRRY